MKDIRTTPPADLFEEILELQDTLDEFRASDRASESASTLRTKLHADRATLEQRQRDMEAQLLQLFSRWDALQDGGEATEQTRAERGRILKEMRDILSNRTYVNDSLQFLRQLGPAPLRVLVILAGNETSTSPRRGPRGADSGTGPALTG